MLITSLATTLGDLNAADSTPTRTATARKVETLLVAEIKSTDTAQLPDCLSAIMNSSSLKALKAVPATVTLPAPRYNGPVAVNTQRVLAQSDAFQKEAMKRGFAVSSRDMDAMIDVIITNGTMTKGQRTLLETGMTPYSIYMLINKLLDATVKADLAKDMAALLKKAAKTHKDQLETDSKPFAFLHDPAQGHASFTRFVTALALMGVKLPTSKTCVNPTVGTFFAKVSDRGSKKALDAELGDLATFISNGMPAPTAALTIDTAIRRHYAPRRSMFR